MNDPNINRKLGPYELKTVVGRGGMGAVYAAINEQDELVAVKLLSPVLAGDDSFRDRFTSEIESLKKLQHPNIVQLFGYGEQDGQLFYAMELINGTSLQEELRQGRRFEWREVSQIAIEICAALKHAHDHGVIHRDLKPANLLYTRQDRIKLLDFGIAKLFGDTAATTGNVMGTVDYMAPEQAEGKAVGPRTDLYSLGSVMYALLTGRPPFTGKSVPEVVHKVRFEPPIPVGRLADDVPNELENIIGQLLDKDPQARIPTSLAVSHRLKAMTHALSLPADKGDTDTSVAVEEPLDAAGNTMSNQQTVRLDEHVDVDAVSITTQESGATNGPDHFTLVGGDRAGHRRLAIPWQTIASLAVLFVMAFGSIQLVRWSARPASADALYGRIVEIRQQDDPRALLTAERDIETFLKNYGNDGRTADVRSLQSEIQLYKEQRALRLKLRQRDAKPHSALEHLYLGILREASTDPDLAARRLSALVSMYSTSVPPDERDRRIIELAEDELVRLQEQASEEAAIQIPLIKSRLSAAQEIQASSPEQAEQIRASLVRLYGNKSWARELLRGIRVSPAENRAEPQPD